MELHLGTTNPAKVAHFAEVLGPHIKVRTMSSVPEVVEEHDDPIDNARLKAMAFAAGAGKPCLAVDFGLHLPGLPGPWQPGTRVRRIPGSTGRPGDEEVLAFYAGLCRSHGGRLRAVWTLAFSIGYPEGRCVHRAVTVERVLATPPCERRTPGYPLDSLQRDEHGRCLAELDHPDAARIASDLALREFVATEMGVELPVR
jgi:8-oxo-dGTP diphosphatase